MTRLLIYASPVDHHRPAEWYQYRDRVREILGGTSAGSRVTVDDDPLFMYGADVNAVIERINSTRSLPREIVLAQWSTIVFYSASVLFLGADVDPLAVRAALSGERFLKEHVGEYSLDSGSCYAYQLYPYTAADIAPTRRIVECVPNRVYVGAAWMVNDADGVPDGERFEVLSRRRSEAHPSREEAIVFRPRIAEIEEEVWMAAAQGDGVIVLRPDDPRLPRTLEATTIEQELPLFLGEDGERAFPCVTIGRCHMDDTLVCLYNHPPVTDAGLQFLV